MQAKTADKIKSAAAAPEAEPPKKKRPKWGSIISGLLLGTAGLASTRLGNLWPTFDVLASFTPHYLFLILGCLCGAVIPRGKSLTAVVVFLIAVIAYGTWPLTMFDPGAGPLLAKEVQLKIGHYNTHLVNTDYAAQEAEIRALNADVLVLIEFGKDKLPIYDHLKSEYPYIETCIGRGRCSAAIISRTPFTAVDFLPKQEDLATMSVRLGPQFGSVSIIAAHFQRFPNLQRQVDHFSLLPKLLETVSGPVILTGDFNATPFSRGITELESATGYKRQTNLPTWPAQYVLPQLAIDHIFLSPGLRPLSEPYAGLSGGSDHLPIAMHVAIPLN